jgi:hypothetical protein
VRLIRHVSDLTDPAHRISVVASKAGGGAFGASGVSQKFQRGGVHAFVAGDDNAAAGLRRAVLPRRHDAAGAGDDRNERDNVMRF